MATSGINGVSIGAIAAGIVFVYAGLKGKSIPSSIQSVIQGKSPSTASSANPITSPSASWSSSDATSAAAAQGMSSGNAAANQAIARVLAAPYGWASGQEWTDLVALWNRESGWSNTAQNPSSGAYGIPQALPPTKMPQSAQPPSDGGSSSASAQIAWGLSYIKATYGDPIGAWAHEESAGWY